MKNTAVLLDANILIDYLCDREPFRQNAAGANYLVTRNISDFTSSPLPAILPEDFLKKLEG